MKFSRIAYYVKRLSQMPLDFLFRKLLIEAKKKLLPRSPFFVKYQLFKIKRAIEANILNIGYEQTLKLDHEQTDLLLERVRLVKSGRYACLGYGVVNIATENDFHHDCIHDYKWPADQVCFDVNFLAEGNVCDCKIPWEKSRLQWLLELSILTQLGLEDKSTICAHLKLWKCSNAYLHGINWVSSMEVAIRLVNLFYCYNLIKNFLDDPDRELFVELFSCHIHYLENFPEESDIPGNHYLFTETGKIYSKIILGEVYNADHYYKIVKRQFNSVGFHTEHSSVYHRFCLDVLLLGYLELARISGSHDLIDNVLQKARNCLFAICSPGGKIPIFGDSDSGTVINFGQSCRSASLHGSDVTETPDRIHLSFYKSINEKELLSYHNEHLDKRKVGYVEPFYVMQTTHAKLIVRVGKLGLGERAPHDHDDFLSFWLFVGDEDCFIEGGAAPYTLSAELREKYVSAETHNCISTGSGYRAGLRAGSIFQTVDKNSFTASFQPLGGQLKCSISTKLFTHKRIFRLADAELHIIDKLSGNFDGCRSRFYISTGFMSRLVVESDSVCTLLERNWYPSYGRLEPSQELCFEVNRNELEYCFGWN